MNDGNVEWEMKMNGLKKEGAMLHKMKLGSACSKIVLSW
jgi:hypothetical protein